MGQKINPKAFRFGVIYNWSSRWFANSIDYRNYVASDLRLRDSLMKKMRPAGITQVDIERSINKIDITIFVSKPGMAIGRGGSGLEEIKKHIVSILNSDINNSDKKKLKFELKVEAVKNINLNSHLVANFIADQLIRRMPHKSIVNQAMTRTMTAGAKGVRVIISGRIGGAEISRRERFQIGTVPLSTIRERIDFSKAAALTKSGYIGVKVWICLSDNKQ